MGDWGGSTDELIGRISERLGAQLADCRSDHATLDRKSLVAILTLTIAVLTAGGAIASQIYETRTSAEARAAQHRTEAHAPIEQVVREGQAFRAAQVQINRSLEQGIVDIKEQNRQIQRVLTRGR